MPGLRDVPGPHIHRVAIPGQATAGTADEFTLFRSPYNALVVAAYWIPKAAVVADPTNFATLTVRNRKGDASGTAKPASRAYSAANSVAFVPEAMALSPTASDLLVNAGDVLTAEKLVSGTGVGLPAGTVEVHLQYR